MYPSPSPTCFNSGQIFSLLYLDTLSPSSTGLFRRGPRTVYHFIHKYLHIYHVRYSEQRGLMLSYSILKY